MQYKLWYEELKLEVQSTQFEDICTKESLKNSLTENLYQSVLKKNFLQNFLLEILDLLENDA